MFILLNKVVTLVFWILAIMAGVQGWGGLLGWLPTIAMVVAGIHVLEVAYFWMALKHKSSNQIADAVQIFIFGIFHMRRFIQTETA